ncbi:MAG: glycosyltransferase family 4 protein, partial [Muribaculaceae bacterium]|nr:glycosyltransferase family 4 protein [Muribaculaceae bacterium]
MKIFHIVAGNVMGEAQRYALDICRHYAARSEEVCALTRDAKAVDRHFIEAGVPLEHAPLRNYPDFFSSMILGRLLRRESPKEPIVVHVHRYRDALTAIAARHFAKRPDTRIVVTRHGGGRPPVNWLRRFIYRQVDAHIFLSDDARRHFLSAWPHGRYPFDTARLHVEHTSRNLSGEPSPMPDKGPFTAMWHGSIRPGKGLMTLLEAMAKLRDTRMRLKIVGIGEPDYLDSLRARAISLGVMERIDWIRRADDPAAIIGQCHFGVLPAEDPDDVCIPNIEYMAAGRAQIATFNGAQREFLTPGVEALEVAPADVDALASAMRRLHDDRELCASLGVAAAAGYAARLSWPRFIARLD